MSQTTNRINIVERNRTRKNIREKKLKKSVTRKSKDKDKKKSNNFILRLKKGSIFYKQKIHSSYVLRPTFEWFSETFNYGSNYGNYLDTYETTKIIKLFNLGAPGAREFLMKKFIGMPENSVADDYCDFQYQGSANNMKFHKSIENYLRKNNFKGTIVREETDFNNCGPTEIVLVPDVTMNYKKYLKLIKSEEMKQQKMKNEYIMIDLT